MASCEDHSEGHIGGEWQCVVADDMCAHVCVCVCCVCPPVRPGQPTKSNRAMCKRSFLHRLVGQQLGEDATTSLGHVVEGRGLVVLGPVVDESNHWDKQGHATSSGACISHKVQTNVPKPVATTRPGALEA